jgi:hypothetical protein
MRLFLFSIILLISFDLTAQKQNFGLFDKDKFYNCSNKELSISLNIYQLNKNLVVESNFCPQCTDTKFYPLKIKKIRNDFYYFEKENYYFILDLSTMLPALILINASANNIKDCKLNPDF